jgi:hypothetical protein
LTDETIMEKLQSITFPAKLPLILDTVSKGIRTRRGQNNILFAAGITSGVVPMVCWKTAQAAPGV